MKEYDYWLIIWHNGDKSVHVPMPFQVGIHPEEYCKAAVDGKNIRYEYHRLVLA